MKGIFLVMTTPFEGSGELDLDSLRENIGFLTEQFKGRDCVLVPAGSTGEFHNLLDRERQDLIKVVVDEANGRLPVLAGTAYAGTAPTIEMSRHAEDCGADGVMVVLPYYEITSGEGAYRHFKAVAESIDIPLMIYNNPITSKSWLKPDLMVKLSVVDGIFAVKENTADLSKFHEMQKALEPTGMKVVNGIGEPTFPFTALSGCRDFVSAYANFAPRLSYEVYESAMKGDLSGCLLASKKFDPIAEFTVRTSLTHGPSISVFREDDILYFTYVAVTKECMNILGLGGGKVRSPDVNLTGSEIEELRGILEDMGLAGY